MISIVLKTVSLKHLILRPCLELILHRINLKIQILTSTARWISKQERIYRLKSVIFGLYRLMSVNFAWLVVSRLTVNYVQRLSSGLATLDTIVTSHIGKCNYKKGFMSYHRNILQTRKQYVEGGNNPIPENHNIFNNISKIPSEIHSPCIQ